MRYIIAVFKSRREAMELSRAMGRLGARTALVSTPSRLSSSCGLSVKFMRSDILKARVALSGGDHFTFMGFFEL